MVTVILHEHRTEDVRRRGEFLNREKPLELLPIIFRDRTDQIFGAYATKTAAISSPVLATIWCCVNSQRDIVGVCVI